MRGEGRKVREFRLQAVFRRFRISRAVFRLKPGQRTAFTDVGLTALILVVAAVLGAVCLFYARNQGAAAAQSIRLFLGSFGVVLLAGLGLCMAALYMAGRHHRRVRREVGIPWTTNGHGTSAMYREMNFQQTVLQLNTRLTKLEDKAHELETVLMQRAAEKGL